MSWLVNRKSIDELDAHLLYAEIFAFDRNEDVFELALELLLRTLYFIVKSHNLVFSVLEFVFFL